MAVKTWVTWGASAVLLAGAWAFTTNVPAELRATDAFAAPVDADGWISTENISLRVDSASLTDTVVTDGEELSGNWLVVNASAMLRHTDVVTLAGGRTGMATGFTNGRASVDGTTYALTTKILNDAESAMLFVGVPVRVSFAFELAPGVDPATAHIEIWDTLGYPTLDGAFLFDVDDLERQPTVELFTGDFTW